MAQQTEATSSPLASPETGIQSDLAHSPQQPTPVPTNEKSFPLDERGVVLITSIGHFLCHFSEVMYGAVMVAVMATFDLDKQSAASLSTIGFILFGFGALPVGVWVDKWGPTRVFWVYFIGLAVAGLVVAASPNAWTLCIALSVLGLVASIYHPVGLAMLSLHTKSRGRALGINGVAGSIGIALGPALGTALRTPMLWRLAYVIVSVAAILSAVVYGLLLRREGQRRQANSTEPLTPTSNQTTPVDDRFVRKSRLRLCLLYAAMLLGGLNYRALLTALPTFLSGETSEGGALATGAVLVFVTLMMGTVGQLLGGWLSDKQGAIRTYPMMVGLLVVSSVLVGLSPNRGVAFVACMIMAIFLFGLQPAENSSLADATSRGRRGLSYGTKFAMTFGIGALGAPLVGFLWEEFNDLGSVFFVIAGSAAVMALVALGAWLVGRNSSKKLA